MMLMFDEIKERVAELVRNLRPYHLILAGVAALILLAVYEPFAPPLLFLVGLPLMVFAWFHEFLLLMRLEDDDLPGRFDKPIWALAMLVLPPVGVLAFWMFRKKLQAEAKPQPSAAAHDLT